MWLLLHTICCGRCGHYNKLTKLDQQLVVENPSYISDVLKYYSKLKFKHNQNLQFAGWSKLGRAAHDVKGLTIPNLCALDSRQFLVNYCLGSKRNILLNISCVVIVHIKQSDGDFMSVQKKWWNRFHFGTCQFFMYAIVPSSDSVPFPRALMELKAAREVYKTARHRR